MTLDELVAHLRGLEDVDVLVASAAGGAPKIAWGDVFVSHAPADGGPARDRLLPHPLCAARSWVAIGEPGTAPTGRGGVPRELGGTAVRIERRPAEAGCPVRWEAWPSASSAYASRLPRRPARRGSRWRTVRPRAEVGRLLRSRA